MTVTTTSPDPPILGISEILKISTYHLSKMSTTTELHEIPSFSSVPSILTIFELAMGEGKNSKG